MNINGTDLAILGFIVGRGRQLPSMGGEVSRVANIPGRVGGVRLGGELQPDQLIVPGFLEAADHATLLANRDALVELLQGELAIRLDDYADREWVGYLQQPTGLQELGADEVATAGQVRLAFLLPDPTARALAESNVGGSTALALGTAPSPLRVQVANGATAPITQVVVQVRAGGAAGTVLRELTWAGNLAINTTLVIDAEAFTVTAGGANVIGGMTADSEFPIADPRLGADYVDIAVTGGGGHGRTTYYRQRWF